MEGDALKMVYEAEKNAEELLKNAEAEAQQILLEAKEKAKEMDISGAVKMKREVQNILIEAKLNARAAVKSLIENRTANVYPLDTLVAQTQGMIGFLTRSEERRVGKECRSRWSPYH